MKLTSNERTWNDMDCVVNFIEKTTDKERVEWLKNIKQ